MKNKLEFKKKKRLNWYLILCFYTSSEIHSRFLIYDLSHPNVKSKSRQAHNFLIHWFGREWCDRFNNPQFYDESKLIHSIS